MKKNRLLLISFLLIFSEFIIADEQDPEQYYEKAKASHQIEDCHSTLYYLNLYVMYGKPSLKRIKSIVPVVKWCQARLSSSSSNSNVTIVDASSNGELPPVFSPLAASVPVVQVNVKGHVPLDMERSTESESSTPWRIETAGNIKINERDRSELLKDSVKYSQNGNWRMLKLQSQYYYIENQMELHMMLNRYKLDIDKDDPKRRLLLDDAIFGKPKF